MFGSGDFWDKSRNCPCLTQNPLPNNVITSTNLKLQIFVCQKEEKDQVE